MSGAILTLAAARLPMGDARQVSAPLSLELGPGSLVVIDPQGPQSVRALADAGIGLVVPLAGQVRFMARDWQEMGAAERVRARSLIGHCFAGGAWLPYMSVMENVTLAARQHRLLADRVIAAHAAQLARQFGLPGIPTALPGESSPADLARASLVRAFLGRPVLVVLEEPRRDLPSDITAPLVHAIRRVRDRGGAVLWLTAAGTLAEPAIPADARYRLAGGRLIPLRAEAAAA